MFPTTVFVEVETGTLGTNQVETAKERTQIVAGLRIADLHGAL